MEQAKIMVISIKKTFHRTAQEQISVQGKDTVFLQTQHHVNQIEHAHRIPPFGLTFISHTFIGGQVNSVDPQSL